MSEPFPEEPPEEEPALGRTPPNDLDAERAVLASMMMSETAIADVVDVIDAGDFYSAAHEAIYDAILALYTEGHPADAVTVRAWISQHGGTRRVGGDDYLVNLSLQQQAIPANVRAYADIVVDKAARRRLIEVSRRNLQMGYDEDSDAVDLWNRAEAEMMAASKSSQSEDYALIGASIAPAIDQIEALSTGDEGRAVSTGFMDLDDLLGGGLMPGQMVTIAARPAVGKSVLGMDLLRAASLRRNHTSVLFSLEMSREECVLRALAAEGKVSLSKMRDGHLADHDWARVAGAASELGAAPMFIDDSPLLNMTEIRAKARRLKQRHDLRLIVIDYLQLMTSGRRVENRQTEVSEFSRQIKLLAKELQVPVVAISQLNRGPEQRTNRRPLMADLRESGSIEQDSDVVILLHREDYYDAETTRPGEADFIVAKNRNGPTRDVAVAFQGHYSRFVDMHRDA